MKEFIEKIANEQSLSVHEMQTVMYEIMSGQVSHEDMADFLLALRRKGASVDEITGAAKVMREFAVPVVSKHIAVLDTCGTGGDKLGTFNISTITAFVVAAAGCIVAKHGNRSVSSNCGSADVLEALGVNIHMDVAHLDKCLDEVGIAFLFAQKLHPAMKYAAPVRKELKIETIFNVLGPLTNPAKATHQMMGVYDITLVESMANVFKNLGLKKAMVVHGEDGLDEISTTSITHVCEFDGQKVKAYHVDPEQYGIKKVSPHEIKGGGVELNTQIATDILKGQKSPKRDIVLLNAAHAIYIAEKAKDVKEGLELAAMAIDSGSAYAKLEALKKFTNQ